MNMNSNLEQEEQQQEEHTNSNNINIYRFKFSEKIISILMVFAKLHQYDDRITFKEAWKEWIKLYSSDIDDERKRLNSIGYTDDVETKMFKSTKYYFKKKLAIENSEDVNSDINRDRVKSEKKNYISLDPYILEEMDLHIKRNCNNNNYSPAWGWENYCEMNKEMILQENSRIINEYELDKNTINNKLKKAYKNKYFQYTRKV